MADSFDGRLLDPSSPIAAATALPTLRRLAGRGTNFVRAYTASPICVPARASLLTGRRPDELDIWSNSDGIAAVPGGGTCGRCAALYGDDYCSRLAARQRRLGGARLTLLEDLAAAGYETAAFGKLDSGGCAGHAAPALSPLKRRAAIG